MSILTPAGLLRSMSRTPVILEGLLNGVDQGRATAATDGPDGWSVVEIVCHLREQKGLSQQDLAQALGVSVATVYNWERGRHEPRIAQFRALALLFGVPMESIELVEERAARERGPAEG